MPFGKPPPHTRMTMLGTLGASEIFSMSISIKWDGPLVPLEPNRAVWEDLAVDCGEWFGDSATRIHQNAVLRVVKFANLDENGLYTESPEEVTLGQSFGNVVANGTGGVPGVNNGGRPENATALAVTLHTGADVDRIKGRFYIPLPVVGYDSDGLISTEDVDSIEGRAKTFIDAINNQPGLDVLNGRVVVASGGRRNLDGSVRLQPALYDVNGVSVGRVPDTQRRRRNRLREGRTMVTVDPSQ